MLRTAVRQARQGSAHTLGGFPSIARRLLHGPGPVATGSSTRRCLPSASASTHIDHRHLHFRVPDNNGVRRGRRAATARRSIGTLALGATRLGTPWRPTGRHWGAIRRQRGSAASAPSASDCTRCHCQPRPRVRTTGEGSAWLLPGLSCDRRPAVRPASPHSNASREGTVHQPAQELAAQQALGTSPPPQPIPHVPRETSDGPTPVRRGWSASVVRRADA